VRAILDKIYSVLKLRASLLCISPISKHVILAYVKTAKELNTPLCFVASLNQIDRDGGYTGWTPLSFKTSISRYIEEFELNVPILLELDHGGPWLKDNHVVKNYSYSEALNDFLKSLEAFIEAGFGIIHIDTTIDIERESGYADLDTAVKRAIDIMSYSEELARRHGVELEYEIGSDRWGFKPQELISDFIAKTLTGLKSRGLNTSKVVFGVADVGTTVKPGNIVNPEVLRIYSYTMLKHGLYLKVHSGDYLENPDELPRNIVGGVNIGPMFAHIMYSAIKDLISKKLSRKLAEEILLELNNFIVLSDKLSKYTGKSTTEIEEYKLGLASRYVWSSSKVKYILERISSYTGVNVDQYLVENLSNVIRRYVVNLGLFNLAKYFAR